MPSEARAKKDVDKSDLEPDEGIRVPQALCPVAYAVERIGGKWKMLLLRSLILNGPQRYNRLLESVAGVSAKELTRNLRELEGSRLVMRVHGEGKETRYGLTPLGTQLSPAFEALIPFGENLQRQLRDGQDGC